MYGDLTCENKSSQGFAVPLLLHFKKAIRSRAVTEHYILYLADEMYIIVADKQGRIHRAAVLPDDIEDVSGGLTDFAYNEETNIITIASVWDKKVRRIDASKETKTVRAVLELCNDDKCRKDSFYQQKLGNILTSYLADSRTAHKRNSEKADVSLSITLNERKLRTECFLNDLADRLAGRTTEQLSYLKARANEERGRDSVYLNDMFGRAAEYIKNKIGEPGYPISAVVFRVWISNLVLEKIDNYRIDLSTSSKFIQLNLMTKCQDALKEAFRAVLNLDEDPVLFIGVKGFQKPNSNGLSFITSQLLYLMNPL